MSVYNYNSTIINNYRTHYTRESSTRLYYILNCPSNIINYINYYVNKLSLLNQVYSFVFKFTLAFF